MISHKEAQEAQDAQKKPTVEGCRLRAFCAFLRLLMTAAFLLMPLAAQASQAEVRRTVQNVFEQLKSHNYGALYELLPASTRTRMSLLHFD